MTGVSGVSGASGDILDEYAAWVEQRTIEGLSTDIATFREERRSLRWERAVRLIHGIDPLGVDRDRYVEQVRSITRSLIEQEQTIE